MDAHAFGTYHRSRVGGIGRETRNLVGGREPAADDYVDWVGIDGYNWGTTREWSSWESLDSLIGRAYRAFAGRKPLMIAEVSSAESGGNKGAWITSAARALKARFPAVRALVWFHIDKETDWRIDSSPSALRSFRALAADPYFRARPPAPRD